MHTVMKKIVPSNLITSFEIDFPLKGTGIRQNKLFRAFMSYFFKKNFNSFQAFNTKIFTLSNETNHSTKSFHI